jgi:hypothetical protein
MCTSKRGAAPHVRLRDSSFKLSELHHNWRNYHQRVKEMLKLLSFLFVTFSIFDFAYAAIIDFSGCASEKPIEIITASVTCENGDNRIHFVEIYASRYVDEMKVTLNGVEDNVICHAKRSLRELKEFGGDKEQSENTQVNIESFYQVIQALLLVKYELPQKYLLSFDRNVAGSFHKIFCGAPKQYVEMLMEHNPFHLYSSSESNIIEGLLLSKKDVDCGVKIWHWISTQPHLALKQSNVCPIAETKRKNRDVVRVYKRHRHLTSGSDGDDTSKNLQYAILVSLAVIGSISLVNGVVRMGTRVSFAAATMLLLATGFQLFCTSTDLPSVTVERFMERMIENAQFASTNVPIYLQQALAYLKENHSYVIRQVQGMSQVAIRQVGVMLTQLGNYLQQ